MDGFGVNVNTGWWNTGEVKPAIDLLADQLGATVFRSVIEEMDWETTNDDTDPNTFNWTYYNSVYSNARFQGVWNTLRYLNQKGITDGLIISFMGKAPDWMGANTTIDTNKEDELVETVASCLYYARFTAGIQFSKISPFNEADTGGVEGPNMGTTQFARVLNKLALKLDAIGMSDVRFHAPEAAGGMDPFFDQIVTYPAIMGKLDLWAIHKYGASTDGAQAKISASSYPSKKFWVTETASFSNILGHLDENPSGILIWDGFDSIYQHAIRAGRGSTPPNDSPGIEAPLIAYNTTSHLYTARKGFYENAQLFKFVAPGSVRIGSSTNDGNLTTYAFRHPATGRLTIVGRNTSGSATTVNGTLSNLPAGVTVLEFHRTNSTLNLARGTDVAVTNNTFSVSIPANTYFTLVTPAAKLDTHEVALDGEGKLVSWFTPQDKAFSHVAKLSADWIKAAMTGPIDPANGLPVIHTHSEYHPVNFTGSGWPNNPAGKHAMLADSMMLYYAYSGDAAVLDAVKSLLDYQLTAAGTTPANYYWANVPWSTSAASNLQYGTDSISEGVGMLEPDKIGELGFHGYLRFYQITGLTRYRDAAIACADALALHVRPGNFTQSPWPFRANAQTGALDPMTPEDYCADVVAPLRLFDELIRLNLGNVTAYQNARTTVWTWLMTYPMVNNKWAQYFEDDPKIASPHSNLNQYNAGQTARYLLERPDLDPAWQAKVTGLISWIEAQFGGTDSGEPGFQYGARTISEQEIYKFKMASHTSRFAAVCAMLAEKTGDLALKDKAFRSLNWCSYMARSNGSVIEGPVEFIQNSNNWFTDGHGDYIRHFMLAMAAFPEWAPADENRLLRSSSVVKSVTFNTGNITYSTFDLSSTEVLRLSSTPLSVSANGVTLSQRTDLTQQGWTYDAATGVMRVRHDAGADIVITHSFVNQPPTCNLASPVSNSSITTGSSILLVASATDSVGTIAKVEFYQGTTKLGEDLTAPYHFPWNNIPAGNYSLTAKATDNSGAVTTSPAVILNVGSNSNSTLGNTGEGTTTDTLTDNTGAYINACPFQATSNATLTGIRAKVGAIAGSYTCALYSDSSNSPSTLIRATSTLTGVSAGWLEFPFNSSTQVTANTYYWLAIWSNDSAARVHADPVGTIRYASYPFGNWPGTVNLPDSGGFTYSIYAFGTSPANGVPVVNAGSNQTLALPSVAQLNGSAVDSDGPSPQTVAWTLSNGPANVTFGNSSSPVTTATFTVPGTYVLRLTAFDGAVTAASDVTIQVTGYNAWIGGFNLPADQLDPNADPDGDGLHNLIEYALERSPVVSEPVPPGLLPGGVPLSLTYKRARADVTYTVQASSQLNAWENLTLAAPPAIGETVTITDAPPANSDQRFLRLKITSP
jgi:O-glycosyl hydrolase